MKYKYFLILSGLLFILSFLYTQIPKKVINEDPIFYGISISKIQDCYTTQTKQNVDDYGICQYLFNSTYINNITKINTTTTKAVNYNCIVGTHINILNSTICKDIGIQINDKKIIPSKYGYKFCFIEKNLICCKVESQGNDDKYCYSGEGCDCRKMNDLTNQVSTTVSKTSHIKEIEIE